MSSRSFIRAHTPSPNSVPFGTTTAARPALPLLWYLQQSHNQLQKQHCRLRSLQTTGKATLDRSLFLATKGRIGQDHTHPIPNSQEGQIHRQGVAILLPHPRSPPNNLLELCHRGNHTGNHDVFGGGRIHPCGQQLGGSQNYRSHLIHILEHIQMPSSYVGFITGNPAHIVGVPLHQIRIEVIEDLPHLLGMLQINAEYNRLGKTICFLQELCQVLGNSLGSRT